MADEAIPTIAKFFPTFKLADVEAGHWLISENPEEFRRGMCHEMRNRKLHNMPMLTTFIVVVQFYQDLQDD